MIKFIDLFAGIGGFHFALKQQGMTCVFSAENNLNACEIYKTCFIIQKNLTI